MDPTLEYGLGRHFAPDERDEGHPMRLLANDAVRRVSKRWRMFSKPLNQGRTGTCVGHGWHHFLRTSPVIQVRHGGTPTPFEIYDRCIAIDEWTDNDRDIERQFGTSVRAGAKALQERGLIGEYTWAFDGDTVADWIGGVDADGLFIGGPVVIGVNWYDGMFEKDPKGFIYPTGRRRGGHCVEVDRYDARGFFSGPNSWGDWGRFNIDGEDLDRLIRENGEACTSNELRKIA